jgi:hypothetical protein
MLRWLPPDEGLRTLGRETSAAHERARLARLAAGPDRPGLGSRLAAVYRAWRLRHALTDQPCRTPDGRIGRTAIVMADGEWTAVCVLP